MNKLLVAKSFLLLLIIACQPQSKSKGELSTEVVEKESRVFPESVLSVFNAHGGFETWSEKQSMEFDLSKGEHYKVDLKSRNVNIQSADWIIGSKEGKVWILPDTASFSDPRFYHSLYYYFASMPFILGDPGINYTQVPDKVFRDTTYSVVKIHFDEGVGDAPKDNYFICYDKVTNQMKWLMYTVTYGEDESNEDYGLINYADWKLADGLLMPSRLVWYKYTDGVDITRRSEAYITNWSFQQEPFDDAIFTAPENARLVD